MQRLMKPFARKLVSAGVQISPIRTNGTGSDMATSGLKSQNERDSFDGTKRLKLFMALIIYKKVS